MNILAIDTSSSVASASVIKDNQLVGEYVISNGKTHSQILVPVIDDALSKLNLKIEDIDVFATTLGPGSFTGLRIGIATAKAFAQAVNKKIIGVSALDCLASNVAYSDGITVCPILDARRGNVYNAVYKNGVKQTGDRLLHLDTVLEEVKGNKTLFLGDGVIKHSEKIVSFMGEDAIFAPAHLNFQRASSVAHIALLRAEKNDFDNIYSLEPIYVRPSQAERELAGVVDEVI